MAQTVASSIQDRIRSGQLITGQYLANVRELGTEFGVSPETVRRALQGLVAERWLTVQPGHGFRVTARGNDPSQAPIAFIISAPGDGPTWDSYHGNLLASIHRAAAAHGWSVLGLGAGERPEELVERLCRARVAGLLVDTPDEGLLARLRRIGLPVVLLEERAPGCDAVAQDNVAGAQLAVEHLLARGCRRFAWFGPLAPTIYSRLRWAGTLAALRDGPGALVDGGTIAAQAPDAAAHLAAVVAREGVDAIVALWPEATQTACAVAGSRGPAVVGWCSDEMLPGLRAGFAGRPLPALVGWSMAELARCALARLAERLAHPDLPPVSLAIAPRLIPEQAP